MKKDLLRLIVFSVFVIVIGLLAYSAIPERGTNEFTQEATVLRVGQNVDYWQYIEVDVGGDHQFWFFGGRVIEGMRIARDCAYFNGHVKCYQPYIKTDKYNEHCQ